MNKLLNEKTISENRLFFCQISKTYIGQRSIGFTINCVMYQAFLANGIIGFIIIRDTLMNYICMLVTFYAWPRKAEMHRQVHVRTRRISYKIVLR